MCVCVCVCVCYLQDMEEHEVQQAIKLYKQHIAFKHSTLKPHQMPSSARRHQL